jgi:uncharacterized protein (TIGR00290 family)
MKTLLSWSTGKDSAWSLHVLKQDPTIELAGLFTTLNADADRVAMHATRRAVMEAQADVAGLPLEVIEIPYPCPNEVYEARLGAFVEKAKAQGVEAMAFGDLFLEDIRAYREKNLKGSGIKPLFPIWQQPTAELVREMVAAGLRARLVSVDPKQIDGGFVGREFDEAFLDDLPESADPCGENGEFHTCVYAGPMFSRPLVLEAGDRVERDGFMFADFKLADQGT